MRATKARTLSRRAISRAVLSEQEPPTDSELAELAQLRPRTRGECRGGLRPCPFVSCRHHLYLDVTEAGSIRLAFPDVEVWEMEESCSLDLAERERDGMDLAAIGEALNVTKEWVRRISDGALDQLARTNGRERQRSARIARRPPRRGPHHSTTMRHVALEQLANGVPLIEVAESTGVPLRTLRDWRDGRSRWAAAWWAARELTLAAASVTTGEEEEQAR